MKFEMIAFNYAMKTSHVEKRDVVIGKMTEWSRKWCRGQELWRGDHEIDAVDNQVNWWLRKKVMWWSKEDVVIKEVTLRN